MPFLEAKVGIVTGGAGGIGRAISDLFAKEGAEITVADIVREGAVRVAAEIENQKGRAFPLVVDVTKQDSFRQMVQAVLDRCGRIDILVNVAGGAIRKLVLETDETEWDQVIDLNLTTRNCPRYPFLCKTRPVVSRGRPSTSTEVAPSGRDRKFCRTNLDLKRPRGRRSTGLLDFKSGGVLLFHRLPFGISNLESEICNLRFRASRGQGRPYSTIGAGGLNE